MRHAALLLFLLFAAPALSAREPVPAPPAHDVPGIVEAQLTPDYWIARLRQPDRVILGRDQIAQQNVRMHDEDPSLHDIEALPGTLDGGQVKAWIEALSVMPERELYDETGAVGSKRQMARIEANLALKSIPQTQVTRYGMAVRRAALRTFPTRLRVFNSPDDHDIDRFQESALFPGDPVAIVHESRDRAWYFVVSQRYAAWVEKEAIAQGDRQAILDYGRRAPYLIVTGATARTVFTPERPAVSDVQLDMGVRVPVLADWPGDRAVNGQHPYAAHVVELPVRAADGTLSFAPALIPRSADVANDYLPLTEANIIRQAFKFLGERYGWGHSYNARDCSGFVSEVYRSFGVLLPRNTSHQAVSPALNRLPLTADDSHDRRRKLLREARVGDLVYIPGHVMMMLGHVDGAPYAIHDTSGMTWRRDDGELRRLHLNGVVVTPILPMLSNADTPTIDRITSIQRIRP
ncbi:MULTISPECIES: SH3 domain-containing protein [unclassified Luteimonas]|uniref:C40 family peptidase n=1 Tax=unclassified Luteimonas TaxID=2629088 RepID=UPI001600CE92|nr:MULTISPECIES: SH3 domain-containing protein [unclassified Luteimonas]MBB1472194.1 SH3 domain-containing protein [Luteimonas sp. MC1782]MBB6599078.1 SH3 domain-containing protein [Luteimonas sp. MC1825]QOC89207.1 SH3 domain-containing protein [Luteimonas sp. MC1825]